MNEFVVNWYATRRHIGGTGSWSLCGRASGCWSIIAHRQMRERAGQVPPDYDKLPVCKFCIRTAEKLGLTVEDGKPQGPTDREIAAKAREAFEAYQEFKRRYGEQGDRHSDADRMWARLKYEGAKEALFDLFKEDA